MLLGVSMNRIFVFGSINIDNVAYTKVMPQPGITVQGESFISNLGGKGANQACAAYFLGANVYFVGAVGKDAYGENVEKFFHEIGLPHHLIKCDNSTGTAIILIDENTAENRIICIPGANYSIKEEDLYDMENMMSKGDILLVQLECSMEPICHAIKTAKEKGLVVVLNPAPYAKDLPEDIYPYLDYFIPNEHEMDSFVPSDMSYLQKAKVVLNKGAKNVIITLGDKGSLCVNNENVIEQQPYKVKAIDTTGAGDCFCGSFVTALSKGKNIRECLDFATKCSSIAVTRKGAISSLPKLEEVV